MRKILFMAAMVPILLLAACEDHVINVPSGEPADTVTVTIKCVKKRIHGHWVEECDTTYSR